VKSSPDMTRLGSIRPPLLDRKGLRGTLLPEGTMIVAGADRRAQYPGELIQIPQVRVTFRYITIKP
jgi:hypothetical protein